MNKIILTIIMMSLLISCEKQDFRIHHRTPQKMDFVQRELPEDLIIGSDKPVYAEIIDLGLSVAWANCNLDAIYIPGQNPLYGKLYSDYSWEDIPGVGGLFHWGEIESKNPCTPYNYEYIVFHPEGALCSYDEYAPFVLKYCFDWYGEKQDLEKGGTILDKFDDAAYIKWGEGYRMPTFEEMIELNEKCTWEYDKSTLCYKVTGPSGKSIFFPIGTYWSSTLDENQSTDAKSMSITKDNHYVNNRMNRWWPGYIRAVRE